ncbi:PDZ domain-containing protein [Clostridium sp. AF19-22AC]|jgi:serine protease Do|uniref:Serine protease Do n=1 Tax=Faecalicatena orotica TaxID=1544 RepID=A0A2Y9C9H9_9FIRM|nr:MULTISPECIES: trypsin-like peptidase domain-containing protein [Clostridia]PWJ32049.1 serine protease Do [Faecalicatena orotica]RHR31890.1 PDZ domain-containing protein [Clostridium sp. AF19-22AC]SSA53880.1 serine protease Do [Faecalicatena orotica]
MENQYNYYNPEGQQGSAQYNSQQNFNEPNNKGPKQKKKMPKAVAVTGFALLFGVVSSATFLTSSIVGSRLLGLNETKSTAKSTAPVNSSSLTKTSNVVTSDVSGIVENVMPSIVSITNMSVQQVQDFFGGVSQQQSESAGTGIIISQNDSELLIVTNNHVVENSETLTVTFNDNTSLEANIKGTDASHDLAVIAVPLNTISDDTMDAIAVATLGDSTKLKVGEPAIAIGNALGYGQSVTTGVISATDRESTTTDQATGQTTVNDVSLIQTDAAINPGNSGGALVNASGEVIGINSSKLVGSSVEGVGYAIPISDVSDIITNLMNQQTKAKVSESERGYLGITGFDVTSEYAQRFSMPLGVYITDVTDGGGAKAAGLSKGGVITELNGTTIDNMETLQKELKYYAKGEKVQVTVQTPDNNGEYTAKNYEITLGAKSE